MTVQTVERPDSWPDADVADGSGSETVDPAPLWTPEEERVLRDATLTARPDETAGLGLGAIWKLLVARSPLLLAIRVAHLVAFVAFLVFSRDLAATSSWGSLWTNFRHPLWTIVLLLLVSYPVRRLGSIQLIRYLSLGLMLTPTIVYYLAGPLNDLITTDDPEVWTVPMLEETVKVLPVVVLLIFLRRLTYQYGLTDILIIGFCLGAGYHITENALYDRTISSGFDGAWGLLLPSARFPSDGGVVVGHPAWTALVAVGLALIVIHRHRPILLVLGAVLAAAPVLDHMRGNDFDWIAPWTHHLFIGEYSMPVLFLFAVIVAIAVDVSTLRSVSSNDHLLGAGWRRPPRAVIGQAALTLSRRRAGFRFIRLRNGIHFRKAYEPNRWPTVRRSKDLRVLRGLGRTGRRAGFLDGVLPADRGWAPDPVDRHRQRWFNLEGWSPYVVGTDGADQFFITEPAPGRPGARPQPRRTISATWARDVFLLAGLVVAYGVYRIATGTVPDTDTVFFMPTGTGGGTAPPDVSGFAPGLGSSLPNAGSPPPGSGPVGGPASAPPAPSPGSGPPGGGPPGDGPPGGGPPGGGPPPDGPPNDGPPDDGPPDDDPEDPPEECDE